MQNCELMHSRTHFLLHHSGMGIERIVSLQKSREIALHDSRWSVELRSRFAKCTIHRSPNLSMSTVQLLNYIRKLRFEHGMTQEELALRTGVSRQTIMSIERGQTNPSVLLAYKIAAAFGVPITSVFNMEGRLAPV